MSVKAMMEFTRITKYSRYNEKAGRRETWAEQVDRVMDMHKVQLGDKFELVKEDWEFARSMLMKRRVLGSQRALQFGGPAILNKNSRMYNCTFSYADRPEFFQGTVWLLLSGCGVGFSIQKQHIAKLPGIAAPQISSAKRFVYRIPDTIEGWANAFGVLLSSYFVKDQPFPDAFGKHIEFDYSLIRPAGSKISNTNGKAPGPKPLEIALEKARDILDNCVEKGRLNSIDAYDIVMHASDCVLSGGIRRSATLALFSADDDEMLNAKTGDWYYKNPQRARSNNSIALKRDEVTEEYFKSIIGKVKEFGEPGFVFVDDYDIGLNPCCEIGLYAKDKNGKSGFAVCNLSEINAAKCENAEDFYAAAKAASILGTFQATYTNFDYLGEVTENIVKDEALLGVSITGIQDNPDISLNKEILRNGAKVVNETNERLAKTLGINPAARTLTVKPSGSSSSLLGVSSGIHPQHAKRYIRRIQMHKSENALKFFQMFNDAAVEESVWSTNKVDSVVSFLCEVPKNARTKADFSAIKLLEDVKLVYENWVLPGTHPERCAIKNITHNVSNTITVKDDEWDDVAKYIFDNRYCYSGVSLLSVSGDKDYPQAPFQSVYTASELVSMYGEAALFASGVIVHAHRAFNNNLYTACDTLLGKGEHINGSFDVSNMDIEKAHIKMSEYVEKKKWLERAKKFAKKYFDGDERKMTYCLKDVNGLKIWTDLSASYSEVPWDQFFEIEDNTKVSETVACAGGNCTIAEGGL